MIQTFCDNVISVFTHCTNVVKIYTYCNEVWTSGLGYWYVSWTPTHLSGSFSMFGPTSRLEDYSGFYSWEGSGSGYIKSNAFTHAGSMTTMETNVLSIYEYAFRHPNGQLVSVSASRCKFIDSAAFSDQKYLSYVYVPNVEMISYGAFANCSSLSSIELPKVKRLEQRVFLECPIVSIDLPRCESIAGWTFGNCTSLVSVSAPVLKDCHHAFTGCTALTSIYLPEATKVTDAFINCTSLSKAVLPQCSTTGASAFYNTDMRSVTYDDFPRLTGITGLAFASCRNLSLVVHSTVIGVGAEAFKSCPSLTYVSLPLCRNIGPSAFLDCTGLTSVYLNNCSYISDSAFYNCTSLELLVLGSTSICKLGAYSQPGSFAHYGYVFTNTPFARGEGSILVPSSLVSVYKASLHWSSLSSVIYPIP